MASAQPAGAQVIHGQATFTRNGNDLLVTTRNGAGTRHSAIDWQSFSVPAGSITQFNQPSADSLSINRVVGADPSAIFGTLRSNGRLVLVNPAGIAVGTGAVVDTAGFTASTLQMSEADAVAGRLRFSNNGGSGALVVQGTVRAQGGDVVLIAPDVQTAGAALVQSDGATVLVAGRKVEITGRGLEGIHMEVQAGDRAVNLGTLQGDAVGILAGTLRHSGIVQAQALSVEGGKVVLKATGDNLVTGAVTARAADGKGGSIDVLGERVGLLAGAALDASGAQGGGQVRVGGDYQGGNAAVPNAAQTYVDASATVSADATQQGDGGRVIVWADDTTRMHGHISARGGAHGGNGGFTEVSGKKYLEFTGLADLRAPKGAAGTLLLDPEDIEIFHDEPEIRFTLPPVYHSDNTFPGPMPGDVYVPGAAFEPSSARTTRLSDAHLSAQLEGSNVLVTTKSAYPAINDVHPDAGQIKVEDNAVITWGSDSHLAMRADRGIEILGTIQATNPDAALHLRALNGGITEGAATGPKGRIEVASLFAYASGDSAADAGLVRLDGANRVERLSGKAQGAAAQFAFHNEQDLSIAGVTTAFSSASDLGSFSGIDAGTGAVTITTPANVSVSSEAPVTGGSIAVTAGGGIFGSGIFATHGRADPDGLDGSINLDAQGDSLSFGRVESTESPDGDWTRVHAGAITLHAAGDIEGGSVVADGTFFAGEGATHSAAGNGGAVSVVSDGGEIRLDSISANAASPSWSVEGVVAGRAGSVTVKALADDVEVPGHVTIGSIGARGGSGVAGTDGGVVRIEATGDIELWASEGSSIDVRGGDAEAGDGGRGGQVFVNAGGSVSLAGRPPLRIEGESFGVQSESQIESGSLLYGAAVDARGGTGGSAGEGGHGGDVSIQLGGQFSAGPIVASGGWGFDGTSAVVNGGAGGHGGTITVQQDSGALELDSWTVLDARGGEGGTAFEEAAGAFGGVGGDGGTITLKALRGDLLMGAAIAAGAGEGGFHAGLEGQRAAGGGLGEVQMQAAGDIAIGNNGLDSHRSNITATAGGDVVLLDALWTGGGAVTLVAGDGTLAAADALAPAPKADASVQVLATIDTRSEVDGSAGSVTLRAPGSVVVGFAPEGRLTLLSAGDDEVEPDDDDGGTTPGITAGAITIATDTLTLDRAIDSGTNATTLTTFSATRAITVGGADAGDALHVDQATLDRIHAGALVIGDAAAAGGLLVQGPITVGPATTLSLRNAGAIGQAAGSLLTVSSLDAQGGSVRLTDVSIGDTLSGAATTGGFEVHNRSAGTLTLGNVTGASVASPVQVTTEGRLRVAGSVSSAAQGNAITLAAGTMEVADGAALVAANGRWLVYLDQLQGNDFSKAPTSFVSGNLALWGRGFADNAPGTIAETGNRYVFAFKPAVDVVAGSASKVYDGTAAFTGLEAAATLTGLVDAAQFGNVFLQDQASGQFAVDGATKNVGSYGVSQGTYGVAGYAVNFTGGTATITPRALNVGFGVQDKVYDGKVDATAVFSDDRIAGDDLAFTGSAAFDDRNAGTGKNAVVRLDALGGADARNYVVASSTQAAQGSIARRALNLVSASAQEKVYDGNTIAAVTFGDDRIAGDDLAVRAAGRFADKNAGTGKQVTLDAALEGADAANYVLALPTAALTADITPRTLNVTASAQGKVYDGTTAATVAFADDRIAGDVLAVAGSGSFADRNAGTGKRVDVQFGALAGADAGNYVLAQPAAVAQADITPAALTIAARNAAKFEGDTLVFRGDEFDATGLVGGDTIGSVTLTSAGAGAAAKADSYAITPSAPAGGSGFLPSNYSITFQDGLLTVLSPQSVPVTEVSNQVVTFAHLFLQEALLQQQQESRENRIGEDAIVVTDTACTPQ